MYRCVMLVDFTGETVTRKGFWVTAHDACCNGKSMFVLGTHYTGVGKLTPCTCSSIMWVYFFFKVVNLCDRQTCTRTRKRVETK